MKMTDENVQSAVDELLAKLTAEIDAETQSFRTRQNEIMSARCRSVEDEDDQRRELEQAYDVFMSRTAPLREHRSAILTQLARLEMFRPLVVVVQKETPAG